MKACWVMTDQGMRPARPDGERWKLVLAEQLTIRGLLIIESGAVMACSVLTTVAVAGDSVTFDVTTGRRITHAYYES